MLVLGNIPPRKEWRFPGIKFEGRVKILPYLKKCSLCVHPARGDTFPVSTLETMATGLPTLVSVDTGTKEVVERVDKRFVVPLDERKIAKRISDYFSTDIQKKKVWSRKFRKEGGKFREKKMLSEFKSKFTNLLESL